MSIINNSNLMRYTQNLKAYINEQLMGKVSKEYTAHDLQTLVNNRVDLSGATINFDTTKEYIDFSPDQSIHSTTLLTSSGGYSLSIGGPPDITFGGNGTDTTTICTYNTGAWDWNVDHLVLPDDFGYLTSIYTSAIFDVDFDVFITKIIATQERVNQNTTVQIITWEDYD